MVIVTSHGDSGVTSGDIDSDVTGPFSQQDLRGLVLCVLCAMLF